MNIGLYLCTGIGGARHGFLAGWLGTLPNFIDNQWRIDLETGHSDGYMNIAKDIECGMSFNQFLNNRSFVLSDRADLFMAGQLHGHALIPYHEDIDYNCVRVLNVDVTHADPAQVQWIFWSRPTCARIVPSRTMRKMLCNGTLINQSISWWSLIKIE